MRCATSARTVTDPCLIMWPVIGAVLVLSSYWFCLLCRKSAQLSHMLVTGTEGRTMAAALLNL